MQNQDNNLNENTNDLNPLSHCSQNIVAPLELKLLALDTDPYKKYNYLREAWHNPSHGININSKEELTSFLNDIEKSKKMWKESGVYLGLILQAVEEDTVIDMGCPIGLAPDFSSDSDKDNYNHITSHEINEFIEMYKQYLTEEIVENLDSIYVEIKPFYAINEQEINYEVVEQNSNKKFKIK